MKHAVLEAQINTLHSQDAPIWKRVAKDLKKPSRQRRRVNLSIIQSTLRENEVAVVPGKVLGSGVLVKPVTVIAQDFSDSARKKITSAGGKVLSLEEGLKSKLKHMRIIG